MARITSTTRLYAVIGSPIEHSLSPIMHNYLFMTKGLDAVYVALRVDGSTAEHFVRLARDNLAGFNVTIPLKEVMVGFMDWVEDAVRYVGALNTVKNEGGRLCGYNTDFRAIRDLLCDKASGSRAIVFGAGGAARAVIYALASCGALITLTNRTLERAERLARWFSNLGLEIRVVPMDSAIDLIKGMDIVVNATSVGLNNDSLPIKEDHLGRGKVVVDLAYRRGGDTPLINVAKSRGCDVVDGLSILVRQGIHSFKLWTNVDVNEDEERRLLEILKTL